MRNSFLPLIALVVVTIAAVLLSTSGAERGSGGPDVQPGIFRLPAKARQQITSAPISVESVVSGAVGHAEARVVLLSGGDGEPLTRALLLGLAEEITRRGGLAILDPSPAKTGEPLPLGSDLRLAVTLAAGAPPAGMPAGACVVTWNIESTVPAPAGDLPAAQWLPDAIISASEWATVTSTVSGTAANWFGWYAAIGRHAAIKLIDSLAITNVTDVAHHVSVATWPAPLTRLPLPPGADELRWEGAFQHPLVRGWVGSIRIATTTNRTGEVIAATKPLLTRMARGGWIAQRSADGAVATISNGVAVIGTSEVPLEALAWVRDHEGIPTDLRFARHGAGWLVTLWQVRPGAPGVVAEWTAKAAAGDQEASAMLAQHGTVRARLAALAP